jgi:hypothetical protein
LSPASASGSIHTSTPISGLMPLAAAGLVELDRAEQVVQVGDGQRHLAVGLGRRGGIVDAQGAVDDGVFGVQAQVDEGRDTRGRADGTGGSAAPVAATARHCGRLHRSPAP